MSLILDALKRAERERRGESGPARPDLPLPSAPASAPRRRDLVGIVVFAGGIALSAFLLWDAFREPPAPEAPPPQAAAPAPQAAPPEPVIKARPAPPEPTVVPGTEGVASLDDLTDEPVLEGPAPAAGAPATVLPKPVPAKPVPAPQEPQPGKPATIVTTPAPPPAAAEVRPTQPQPAPAQSPPPAEAAPAPAQVPPALTQPAPLRKFREMPPDYRADFPALKVEIHVYEKQPQRRFVMVNGRRYREGERLAEGPALLEIVPDGMVLEFRGEKVLYTLGR